MAQLDAMLQLELITPDWPAPPRVRSLATTRSGGVSEGRYSSLNLGLNTGDVAERVTENRRRLTAFTAAPQACWLDQVHGVSIVDAGVYSTAPVGDASICRRPGTACAILTADCLPVLICDRAGSVVAAAHCGWRGLASGVLSALVAKFATRPDELMVWFGPAIGPSRYEVGDDVRAQLLRRCEARTVDSALRPGAVAGKWWADLCCLARSELLHLGVHAIYGGNHCTHTDARFYSYRRDGVTGRMAALIWLAEDDG